jgi:integrase
MLKPIQQSRTKLATQIDQEASLAIAKTKTFLINRGCEKHFYDCVESDLVRMAKNTDIFDTEKVNNRIATAKVMDLKTMQLTDKLWSDGYRTRIVEAYAIFCEQNNLKYTKPKYRTPAPIALIPKTEHVQAIIANSAKRIGVIFQIMSETAIEGYELQMTPRKQINAEEGIISVIGTKRHDNGTFKLKSQTAEMLRRYLATHTGEYPFPKVSNLKESWRHARKTTSEKLCNPEIMKIPLKNLRNYAGAIFYLTMGKDPIATMHYMRHKDIETTMDYLRGIQSFALKAELISKSVKLGEPDTIKNIMELAQSGFTKFTEADGYQIFTKLNI